MLRNYRVINGSPLSHRLLWRGRHTKGVSISHIRRGLHGHSARHRTTLSSIAALHCGLAGVLHSGTIFHRGIMYRRLLHFTAGQRECCTPAPSSTEASCRRLLRSPQISRSSALRHHPPPRHLVADGCASPRISGSSELPHHPPPQHLVADCCVSPQISGSSMLPHHPPPRHLVADCCASPQISGSSALPHHPPPRHLVADCCVHRRLARVPHSCNILHRGILSPMAALHRDQREFRAPAPSSTKSSCRRLLCSLRISGSAVLPHQPRPSASCRQLLCSPRISGSSALPHHPPQRHLVADCCVHRILAGVLCSRTILDPRHLVADGCTSPRISGSSGLPHHPPPRHLVADCCASPQISGSSALPHHPPPWQEVYCTIRY